MVKYRNHRREKYIETDNFALICVDPHDGKLKGFFSVDEKDMGQIATGMLKAAHELAEQYDKQYFLDLAELELNIKVNRN